MTDRAEIERLLNQTGRTLEGLPTHYHSDDVHNRIKELTGVWGLWTGMPKLGAHILHQSDVIELLVGALRDALDARPEWISVKDRMPDAYKHVIVHVRHTEKWRNTMLTDLPWHVVEEDIWLGDKWSNNADDDIHEVTHWMPMPEPPKEESNA